VRRRKRRPPIIGTTSVCSTISHRITSASSKGSRGSNRVPCAR
jgi:hypothetical protein